MVDVAEALRGGEAARMILQVHDELVFETPSSELPALSALSAAAWSRSTSCACPCTWTSGAAPELARAH